MQLIPTAPKFEVGQTLLLPDGRTARIVGREWGGDLRAGPYDWLYIAMPTDGSPRVAVSEANCRLAS